ncbi:hypothetical protein BHM03_00013271 [Ensete ventricosum]|nr:hypothetical protein BHM03_00013271 [Ensete ventricosum]
MITATEEPKLEDTALEPKENDTPQPVTRTVPTLAGYTNLQKLKIEGFLEQQSIIILINTGSTHNFMSSAARRQRGQSLSLLVAAPASGRPCMRQPGCGAAPYGLTTGSRPLLPDRGRPPLMGTAYSCRNHPYRRRPCPRAAAATGSSPGRERLPLSALARGFGRDQPFLQVAWSWLAAPAGAWSWPATPFLVVFAATTHRTVLCDSISSHAV